MEFGVPDLNRLNSAITPLDLSVGHFEIKGIMFQMFNFADQFGGLPSKDPHLHLKSFMEVCDAFVIPGVIHRAPIEARDQTNSSRRQSAFAGGQDWHFCCLHVDFEGDISEILQLPLLLTEFAELYTCCRKIEVTVTEMLQPGVHVAVTVRKNDEDETWLLLQRHQHLSNLLDSVRPDRLIRDLAWKLSLDVAGRAADHIHA